MLKFLLFTKRQTKRIPFFSWFYLETWTEIHVTEQFLRWFPCIFTNYCSFHISLSKAFWLELFYYLYFSNWNFYDVCRRFLYKQKRNFSLIRQKTKHFPIEPHYKNRPTVLTSCLRHVYRHEVTKVGDFYNGVYWEIPHFLSDPTEISFLLV